MLFRSDLCTRGETHLKLVEYLVRKHRASYRAHLIEVLCFKEGLTIDLRREHERLEDELQNTLAPMLEARREELRRLKSVLARRRQLDRPHDAARSNLEDGLKSALQEIAALRAEYERSVSEVAALRASASWKMTAAVRALYDLLFRRPNGDLQ